MIKPKDLFNIFKSKKKKQYKIMDLGSFPLNKEFMSARCLNEDGEFVDFNILRTTLAKMVDKSWFELIGINLEIENKRNDIYYMTTKDGKDRVYPIKDSKSK